MIFCTLSHAYFTHYSQEKERKRGLYSGIVLTIAGLGYSTFQTLFIVKTLKKEMKNIKKP
jgi:putative effector of murein hydrolase